MIQFIKKPQKLLGVTLLGALSLMIFFATCFFYLKSRLPVTEGELKIADLKDPVRVIRDRFGIPHIFAKNEKDLYFAYGFTIAGDRLFQMDIGRRLAHGELSEILGPPTLELDKFFRTLRFKEALSDNWQRHAKELDPNMNELITSFLHGINSYIQTRPLPIEFTLLGYTPKPFTLEDIFGFIGHMSFNFAWTFETNLLLSDLAKKLSPGKINEMRQHLRGLSPSEKVPRLGQFHLLPHQYYDFQSQQIVYDTIRMMVASFGPIQGSNSWVLSGKRSQSGFPLLANDPHISFSSPNIWYEAHLSCPTFEVYGHFLPLIPFPALGHNKNMAWALTMSLIDEVVFFKEEFNPHNPKLIKNEGQWHPIHYYETAIKVKGEEDMILPVRLTPRGPLLTEIMPDRKGTPLSLFWTFYHPDNLPLQAFYHLSRSTTPENFAKNLSMVKSPGLNISYADRAGNIAWWVVGLITVRPPGLFGDMILDATKDEHKLLRRVPFAENPHLINPPSGVIVSANYIPPVATNYRVEGTWSSGERYQRIAQLLSTKEKWSLEELKAVQTDSVDLLYQTLLPQMLSMINVAELKPSTYLSTHPFSLVQNVLNILHNWKGDSTTDSIGITIFSLWIENLIKDLLEADLSDTYKSYCKLPDSIYFLQKIFSNEKSLWRKNGTLVRALHNSFMMTLHDLVKTLGDDPDKWRWGKVHTVEYSHPLGKKWPFNYIFNLGPYEAPGGHHQVNCMEHSMCNGDFNVVAGPTTRRLIDLADTRFSWGILPIGVSGNLADPHHHDQVQMFLRNEYRLQLMDETLIKEQMTKELLLTP